MVKDSNSKIAISIRNLDYTAGSNHILKNINISFEQGEFIGIIGPNGSGKTTLLRHISAWLKPEKNAVLINERDVLSFSEKELAREMALVAQSSQIEFEFTAMDVVLMGRSPYISRFQDESRRDLGIARNAMEVTHTWHLKDRTANSLSGGELQRVMIARALAQDTSILLMDEPISHLDIHHQIEILDLVKGLQIEKGLTVVAVLHDLNLAAQYCDELILLHNGEICCSGSAQEVLTQENIYRVYGINVYVMKNPINGFPLIIPISSFNNKHEERALKKQVKEF